MKTLFILILALFFNAAGVNGQLMVTTNIDSNTVTLAWPSSIKNQYPYEKYVYDNPYIERWNIMSSYSKTTINGTNYIVKSYTQAFFPTNCLYELRPSFSVLLTWQSRDNVAWYDFHYIGPDGLCYDKTLDASTTRLYFEALDPTMVPMTFRIYFHDTDNDFFQYLYNEFPITLMTNSVSPPRGLRIVNREI